MTSGQVTAQAQASFGLKILAVSTVSGGDIARAHLLETETGPFFLKRMGPPDGLHILQAEADGLKAIAAANAIDVPVVVGCKPFNGGGALLLEYIPGGRGSRASIESLGRGLARLHETESGHFGWHRSNYIGSLPQVNTLETQWAVFYARHRLWPQFLLAVSRGRLQPSEIPPPETLEERIASLVPEAAPALLHGDLWGGNYLISSDGTPYLIDPAVYYGHSEVDIAMSKLFGGFPPAFYDAYFEINPPESGFGERLELYQLYYLLVHLNLFGRSYYPQVARITSHLFG